MRRRDLIALAMLGLIVAYIAAVEAGVFGDVYRTGFEMAFGMK